ncbi:LysR substrate-binding domain-containing protein [uncultured Rothia sp.]|uniref:LysR substrate-binding domain-containing protein n=1 Tax=uncultured Rothia sp. TaxID=316088 RepID=UPI00321732B3
MSQEPVQHPFPPQTQQEKTGGAQVSETTLISSGVPEKLVDYLLNPEKASAIPFDAQHKQLRVGYVPGVMPGKWFSRWHERYDVRCRLIEIPLADGAGIDSLLAQEETAPLTHMVLLRPEEEAASADRSKYHSITLYREKMVVVFPLEHVLSIFEESVPLAELAEEFMLQEPETVPQWKEISEQFRTTNPQKLPDMRDLRDAIELVAAGLGLLIVPMSIARYYHRKDLTFRTVEELDEACVNLVWKRCDRSDEAEEIIQDFVGICRGRTAGSDRGTDSLQTKREKARREKEEAQRKKRAANTRRETRDRKAHNAKQNGNARQHQAQSKMPSTPRKGSGREKR